MDQKKKNTATESESALDLLMPGVRERIRFLYRIRDEFAKESDRGCALLAAAYLDSELGTLLGRLFTPQTSAETERLFEFNGPAGTFSAKIDLAAALAAISPGTQRALHLVRKVRNEFAHLDEPITFESPSVRDRVKAMWPTGANPHQSPRDLFVAKVQAIAASVHVQQARTHPRHVLEEEEIRVCDTPEAQELEVASRTLMAITAPDITYEQAMAAATSMRDIASPSRAPAS